MRYKIAAFYKFIALADAAGTHLRLKQTLSQAGLCGTLLVAPEGINGTLAGCESAIAALIDLLAEQFYLAAAEIKFSHADEKPFNRLKVRLKREIITFGQPQIDGSDKTRNHVAPEEWDAIIADAEVFVLDTRNRYETALGKFAGAHDPDIEHFTDFAAYAESNLDPARHKKIAMYCTGGIRCEKASRFLLQKGFSEVYQLQGGILKYLEVTPPQESLWQGDCYIFDKRMALAPDLSAGHYKMCHSCGTALSHEDIKAKAFEDGVSCSHCHDKTTVVDKARFRNRQKQMTD